MSAKPKPLPTCGTCPYAKHEDGNGVLNLWCHGAPPSAYPGHAPGTFQSVYPPVRSDLTGCSLHPKWPKR